MSQQLLLRFDNFDKAAFDDDAENRANAGLSVLQLWQEGSTAHWALLQVNDKGKAQGWIDKTSSLGHGPSGHHFLTTL